MRLRLSVQVTPLAPRGPTNSLFPNLSYRRPQESLQKFVHLASSETTIGQLWTEIEQAYATKYLTQSDYGQFAIKKLQDEASDDLDISFTLGDLFEGVTGPKIIKVIQTYVDRESSIPITSSLRPTHAISFKRPAPPPPPSFESNKRRKTEQEQDQNDYSDIHPDRPLRSRERDLEILRPNDNDTARRAVAGTRQAIKQPKAVVPEEQLIEDSEDEREIHRRQRHSDVTPGRRRPSAQDDTRHHISGSMTGIADVDGLEDVPKMPTQPARAESLNLGSEEEEDDDGVWNIFAKPAYPVAKAGRKVSAVSNEQRLQYSSPELHQGSRSAQMRGSQPQLTDEDDDLEVIEYRKLPSKSSTESSREPSVEIDGLQQEVRTASSARMISVSNSQSPAPSVQVVIEHEQVEIPIQKSPPFTAAKILDQIKVRRISRGENPDLTQSPAPRHTASLSLSPRILLQPNSRDSPARKISTQSQSAEIASQDLQAHINSERSFPGPEEGPITIQGNAPKQDVKRSLRARPIGNGDSSQAPPTRSRSRRIATKKPTKLSPSVLQSAEEVRVTEDVGADNIIQPLRINNFQPQTDRNSSKSPLAEDFPLNGKQIPPARYREALILEHASPMKHVKNLSRKALSPNADVVLNQAIQRDNLMRQGQPERAGDHDERTIQYFRTERTKRALQQNLSLSPEFASTGTPQSLSVSHPSSVALEVAASSIEQPICNSRPAPLLNDDGIKVVITSSREPGEDRLASSLSATASAMNTDNPTKLPERIEETEAHRMDIVEIEGGPNSSSASQNYSLTTPKRKSGADSDSLREKSGLSNATDSLIVPSQPGAVGNSSPNGSALANGDDVLSKKKPKRTLPASHGRMGTISANGKDKVKASQLYTQPPNPRAKPEHFNRDDSPSSASHTSGEHVSANTSSWTAANKTLPETTSPQSLVAHLSSSEEEHSRGPKIVTKLPMPVPSCSPSKSYDNVSQMPVETSPPVVSSIYASNIAGSQSPDLSSKGLPKSSTSLKKVGTSVGKDVLQSTVERVNHGNEVQRNGNPRISNQAPAKYIPSSSEDDDEDDNDAETSDGESQSLALEEAKLSAGISVFEKHHGRSDEGEITNEKSSRTSSLSGQSSEARAEDDAHSPKSESEVSSSTREPARQPHTPEPRSPSRLDSPDWTDPSRSHARTKSKITYEKVRSPPKVIRAPSSSGLNSTSTSGALTRPTQPPAKMTPAVQNSRSKARTSASGKFLEDMAQPEEAVSVDVESISDSDLEKPATKPVHSKSVPELRHHIQAPAFTSSTKQVKHDSGLDVSKRRNAKVRVESPFTPKHQTPRPHKGSAVPPSNAGHNLDTTDTQSSSRDESRGSSLPQISEETNARQGTHANLTTIHASSPRTIELSSTSTRPPAKSATNAKSGSTPMAGPVPKPKPGSTTQRSPTTFGTPTTVSAHAATKHPSPVSANSRPTPARSTTYESSSESPSSSSESEASSSDDSSEEHSDEESSENLVEEAEREAAAAKAAARSAALGRGQPSKKAQKRWSTMYKLGPIARALGYS